VLATCTASAQDPTASWFEQFWKLPTLWFFAPAEITPEPDALLLTEPEPLPCSVADVPAIEDPQAQAFEASVGSAAVVYTDGLTPATARALARFENVVTSIGGSIVLTSAYRPSAYQDHLQAVWDKWMFELRNNEEPGCQERKMRVGEEFTRHQLLPAQRPVPFSDHTRGLAFDAAVTLPVRPHRKYRRINLDALARKAGIRRPDIVHDPVHYKLRASRA